MSGPGDEGPATPRDLRAPEDAAQQDGAPWDARPEDAAPVSAPLHPPGPSLFSLEGRAVPGLYLVGWLGTLMGVAVVFVSFMAVGSAAAPWLFLAGTVLSVVGIVSAAGSQAIERRNRPWLAYRGPSPVLVFAAVLAVTLVGVVLVLAPLSALGLDARSPLATTLSLVITTVAYLALVRLLVVGPGALTWRDMGLGLAPGPALRDLALGALLAVPVLVVTLALSALLAGFLSPPPSVLPPAGDAMGLAANLLSAAILAPVGEELFFRGFATTAWARTAGPRVAILRGAVFFAIAHVIVLFDASFATGAQRALFAFVALLPVGVTLGWLFLARRSLYAPIGLHGAFNAIQILALFGATGAA